MVMVRTSDDDQHLIIVIERIVKEVIVVIDTKLDLEGENVIIVVGTA